MADSEVRSTHEGNLKRKIRALILIVVVILLAGGGYFFYWKRAHRRELVVKAKQKVYLIGIDGASWNLMAGPLSEGKLPHFKKLMEEGTYGPLKSFVPTKSPILWTSIATGKSQLKHGIGNFTAEKDGQMIPVSGGQRITKAYWNILSDYGLRVGVVNWWVTWPPEKINGYMVSDRWRNTGGRKADEVVVTYPADLIQQLPKVGMNEKRYQEDRVKFGLPENEHPDAESKTIDKQVQG